MQGKQNILITGANGFLGQTVAKALHAEGYPVIGLDLGQVKDTNLFEQWLPCDLTRSSEIRHAFEQYAASHATEPMSVFHFAAHYDFSGQDSPLYEQLTIEGTRRLLHHLQGFNVQQFVFASTILVMDEAGEQSAALNEDSPTNPQWRYPESKLQAEQVIAEERDHIPAVIHRIAGVYSDWCQSIPIAQQITRIFERKFESYFFPGNAQHSQPFIHIEDVVECYKKTIASQAHLDPWEIFLIGEDTSLSYSQLQDLIGEEIYAKEWPTIRVPKFAAKAGAWMIDKLTPDDEFIHPWMIDLADAHYPIDISKARQKLNWQPKNSLADKLKMMIQNLKINPETWYKLNKLEFDWQDLPEKAQQFVGKSRLGSDASPGAQP